MCIFKKYCICESNQVHLFPLLYRISLYECNKFIHLFFPSAIGIAVSCCYKNIIINISIHDFLAHVQESQGILRRDKSAGLRACYLHVQQTMQNGFYQLKLPPLVYESSHLSTSLPTVELLPDCCGFYLTPTVYVFFPCLFTFFISMKCRLMCFGHCFKESIKKK